jgi:hypothetical protein
MPSYLERYQQGEYVQVWKELVAAGDAVRQEPLLSDARAVANETMRRAKHNVDLLFVRLRQLGYDFYEPQSIIVPATPDQLADLDNFEQKIGPVPLSLRAWIETVGTVNFMGTYPRLSIYHSGSHFAEIGSQKFGETGSQVMSMDDMFSNLNMDDLEHVPGPLPSLIKNMQKLGLFPPVGEDAKKTPREKPPKAMPMADRIESDPLVVEPYIMGESFEHWADDEEGPHFANIAPDSLHKSGVGGSDPMEIRLLDAAADSPLLNTDYGKLTFVEYLRLSFEWAGFPGLKDYDRRDEELLTSLKVGLMPL